MSIFDVRHQPRAQRMLQRCLARDRLPHAFLFHGPEGVGRELLACELATMLLCGQPARRGPAENAQQVLGQWNDDVAVACDQCESCRLIRADGHPDLHLIHRELIKQHPQPEVRARKGIDLGIDVIRTFVIDRVAMKPTLGRAKVFIIREAEKMTAAAQNALLKTLEEPPATTYLVLIATSEDALLATVRSRCQPVPFGLLPQSFVQDHLTALNDGLSADTAAMCALYAAGSLGAAQRCVDDGLCACEADLRQLVSQLSRISPTESAKVLLARADRMSDAFKKRDRDISNTEAQRRALRALFALLGLFYREVLHAAVADAHDTPSGPLPMDAESAARAIDAIHDAERQLNANANVQLCIESLIIHLARVTHGAAPR